MNKEQVLDISWDTIFKIVVTIFFFYFIIQVKSILILFAFALIISMLFNPAIKFLEDFKIPKVFSVSIVYSSLFIFIGIVFYFILVALATEVESFAQVLPIYFQQFSPYLQDIGIYAFEDIISFFEDAKNSIAQLTSAIFNASFAFFGGVFTTFLVMTMAFFLSLEDKIVDRAVVLIFPKKYEKYVCSLWKKSQQQVSGWFLSRILSCIIVGLITIISALILGVKYPFSLGLIGGLFNFIPYVGPVIAGLFMFSITAIDSLTKAIFIVIVYGIAQLIENSILDPILSKKFVGLSPVVVILAITIGETLWGFLGALLAIPLAGIVFEFLKDFLDKKKREEDLLNS